MSAPAPASSPQILRARKLADVRRLLKAVRGRRGLHLLKLSAEFFKDASDSFVLGYEPEPHRAILSAAYKLILATAGRRVGVSVYNPTLEVHGYLSDRTIIQITAPDGPFYVTSVRERLRAMDHTVEQLIHPIVPVSWTSAGGMRDIGDAQSVDRQSLIHIEIERVDAPARLNAIEREIRSVFAQLRLVVDDFKHMRQKLRETVGSLSPLSADDHLIRFLNWMDDGNFVYMGYREYDLTGPRGKQRFAVSRGSGLGILRDESRSRYATPAPLKKLSASHRRCLAGAAKYVIAQTTAQSPVYRHDRMICVAVKREDERGRAVGERRWMGLFTNRVEGLPATEIPILEEKFETIVKAAGAEIHSHNYREIYGLFAGYPKDFLFGTDVEDIRRDIRAAMSAQSAHDFKATFRPSRAKDEISVMVVMSKEKFSRDVRLKIEDCLRRKLQATSIDYGLSMGAEGGEFARLYFSCLTPRKTPVSGGFADLERELAELAKTWSDRLHEELAGKWGTVAGRRLHAIYGAAFSVEFHAHTPPSGATHDIAHLESLYAPAVQAPDEDSAIEISLFNSKSDTGCSRLKLYHLQTKLVLSDIMPILTDHGLRVLDEVSNSVRPRPEPASSSARPAAFVHTFRINHDGRPIDLERIGRNLCESIRGSMLRRIECDPLCALILSAGLAPRDIALLRLYRNYLHQIVPVHTLRSIETALTRNPEGARLLVERFRARFDPETGKAQSAKRRRLVQSLSAAFEAVLDMVSDIVEDRILRLLANAIESTARTNYFRLAPPDGRISGVTGFVRPALGVKIRGSDLQSVPKPVPLFEIFVSDPDFEGIHLRGGRISRGGIRHSDRRDDFRTEILGLMKTQVVKNAIIVPGGAKGGFVVKAQSAGGSRRETVIAAYRRFIRTLLDLTDNYSGGRLSSPAGSVMYDGGDPYLVVAADKGTADFSDIANALSRDAGFWLGDAFASGGETGYDHKKLGITARGAFECIRHHLEMRGRSGDARAIEVTIAGIGDMSGDVFGNGMLCADGLKIGSGRVVPILKAAFNHQSIFIDPAPDAARSAAERRRMARLKRSTWEDYDRRAISPGGGVYSRQSKKITLSAAAAAMLGMSGRTASGEDIVRQILKLDVDLLYNGGIGVYVKSSIERTADVGDAANDRVRIDASELRCRIIGEGGNNGLTQAARIEYAKSGGRVNTDALDNSAGVDLSDHEVNLKILLGSGRLTEPARRKMLKGQTGEICRMVLADNVNQSRALTYEEWRSAGDIADYPRLLEWLSTAAGLSRSVEGLPGDKELAERARQGTGMYRPELAVILAYVKLAIEHDLLESGAQGDPDIAGDPVFGPFLRAYFPEKITRRYGRLLARHRLADQIAATVAANTFVNQAGLLAAFRLTDQTGMPLSAVLKAYFAAESVIGSAVLRKDIDRAAIRLAASAASSDAAGRQTPAFVSGRAALEESLLGVARWILAEFGGAPPRKTWARFQRVRLYYDRIERILPVSDRARFEDSMAAMRRAGFAPKLSRRIAAAAMTMTLLELDTASARLRSASSI